MAQKKEGVPPPTPDSGWSWVVVGCSFMVLALVTGYMNSIGIFFLKWKDEFGVGVTEVGWVGVIIGSLSPIAGLPAGGATSRWGCRTSVILGGVIMASTVALTGLSTQLWHIYLFSIATSLGMGFGYQAAVTVIGHNFQKYLGAANGLAYAGVGAGIMALPPLTQHLIDKYSWNEAFFILGSIFLLLVLFGLMMRPTQRELFLIQNVKKEKTKVDFHSVLADEEGSSTEKRLSSCWGLFTFLGFDIIFKNFHIMFITVGLGLTGFGYYSSIVYLALRTKEDLQVTSQQASYVISAVGIGSFFGRGCHGILLDTKLITAMPLFSISSFFCAVSAFSMPLIYNYWGVLIAAIVLGITSGMSISVTSMGLRQIVTPKEFSVVWGIAMVHYGIGNCAGVFLMGFLYDVTNNFRLSFFVAGFALLLACICVSTEHFLHLRSKRRQIRDDDDTAEIEDRFQNKKVMNVAGTSEEKDKPEGPISSLC